MKLYVRYVVITASVLLTACQAPQPLLHRQIIQLSFYPKYQYRLLIYLLV
jgi:hypothetical protein